MTAETLEKIYLQQKNILLPEYQYNDRSNLIGVIEKAYMLDFEINLMKLYMKKKYITNDDIKLLLKGKSSDYIEYAKDDLKEIVERTKKGGFYLNFIYLQKYVIGYILSTHILARIRNNKKYLDEYVELVDNSNEMEFIDTLKTLNLELVDYEHIILSNKSLNLLKEEYKNNLKRL